MILTGAVFWNQIARPLRLLQLKANQMNAEPHYALYDSGDCTAGGILSNAVPRRVTLTHDTGILMPRVP